MPSLNQPYTSIAQILSNYTAIDHIYDDIQAIEKAAPPENKSVSFAETIALERISFRYDNINQDALNELSLRIQKGEKIGFVGPTGSGKSTLINAIMGLLEPASGSLSVDSTPIGATTQKAWQQQIGYVPQDIFLFDASIAHNIALGESIDLARVEAACATAQISTFIESELAEGYETLIGESGVRLSGGQRQRLGLARALYRQPQVLVLDEATSALDRVTEAKVVDAILEHLPGVTILMIAHRISTVQGCDRLYVLDRGSIIDEGSYAELLSSSKLFRELARFN